MELIEAARSWHDYGVAPIPIWPRSKKPKIRWAQYQRRLPSDEDLAFWFGRPGVEVNIALVTGGDRGLAVIDFDSWEAYQAWYLWATEAGGIAGLVAEWGYRVLTGRGVHIYTMAERAPRGSIARGVIDIKASGGYVLAPPSVHPSGSKYRALDPKAPLIGVPDLGELFPFDIYPKPVERAPAPVAIVSNTELEADPWKAAEAPRVTVDGSAVERIKRSITIEEILGISSNGRRWFTIRCPLHDDKNPSFWVNTEAQLCGCYAGCNDRPMDVINLYARIKGLSNNAAIEELLGRL